MHFITFIFHILVSSYLFIYLCRVSTLNQHAFQRERKGLIKCFMMCLWLAMEISMEEEFLNLETLGVLIGVITAMGIFISMNFAKGYLGLLIRDISQLLTVNDIVIC
jgi:hypothetical protein